MRVICAVCKILIREKEPLEDERESHSYCPECVKILDKMEEENGDQVDKTNP